MPLKSLGNAADHIQTGSGSDRPRGEQGEVRFNTDIEDFEIWEGSRWVSMRPPTDPYSIKDNDRELSVNYGRGLHIGNNALEAYLGSGLSFDNKGRIQTSGNGDKVVFHQPVLRSIYTSDIQYTQTWTTGVMPISRTLSFPIPETCNGAIIWGAYRVVIQGNNQLSYPPNQPYVAQSKGSWSGYFSGRNCFAPSAANNQRIGAAWSLGVTGVAAPGGEPADNKFESGWWNIKIEELSFDARPGNIDIEFSYESIRNASKIYYNTIRCAILPFEKG